MQRDSNRFVFDTQRLHWICAVLVGVAGTANIFHFLRFWQWNYNSDTVLVALAAERFLTHGELPLFVPEVGYQGLLVEVPLTALVFKLFGMSVWTLNWVPTFFYVLLLLAFYRVTQLSFGRWTALLSLLFLLLSPPQWYAVCLRSIPNYPQTYLAGFCLFLLYRRLLNGPSVVIATLFGMLAGFSLYTYGQIVYFLLAILLHASLFYLRAIYRPGMSLSQVLLPVSFQHDALALWIAKRFLLGMITLSLLAAFVPWGEARIGPNRLEATKFLFVGGVAFAGLHLLHALWNFRSWLGARLVFLASLGAGFIAGYFPKLYYNQVLGLKSIQKLQVGGGWGDIFHRVRILWNAAFDAYSLDNPVVIVVAATVLGLGIGYFVRQQMTAAWKFIRSEVPSSSIFDVSFGFVLFGGILVPLLASAAFSDETAIRYALALCLPIATALGFSVTRALVSESSGSKRAFVKLGATVFAVLFLGICVRSYRQGDHYLDETRAYAEIHELLQEQGVKYALADYWYGYSMRFLYPDLTLHPLYGEYLSHWQEPVLLAERIALIHPKSEHVAFENDSVRVHGRTYKLEQTFIVSGRQVHILNR